VQLGMWPEASTSNEAAWAASDAWIRRKGLDVSHHDFHSLSWLQSIRLEQGKRREAAATLALARTDLGAAREKRSRLRVIYAQMVADFLSETDDWARADELLAPLANAEPARTPVPSVAAGSATPPPVATCHAAGGEERSDALNETLTVTLVGGLRALAGKNAIAAEAAANALAKLIPSTAGVEHDFWQASELEIRGRVAGLKGNLETATAKLKAAIDIDERRPPSGPVQGVTPRERLADLLLAKGRASEALQNYRRVLDLHPRRARALLGTARAAAAVRDHAASSYWSDLAAVWSKADPDLPEIAELLRATGRETSNSR
jgi:tetratricopeptide (TPR) repeat protein